MDRIHKSVIWQNPERMSGAPCFYGTRVPIQILFDYLQSGASLDEFLDSYPTITIDMAKAVLEEARSELMAEIASINE